LADEGTGLQIGMAETNGAAIIAEIKNRNDQNEELKSEEIQNRKNQK
jgi:hypothetical protein